MPITVIHAYLMTSAIKLAMQLERYQFSGGAPMLFLAAVFEELILQHMSDLCSIDPSWQMHISLLQLS